MTRDTAHALGDAINDAGFSCQVTLGNDDVCSVRVLARDRLVGAEIRTLAEIGERHGCDMHLLDDGLTYFQEAGR